MVFAATLTPYFNATGAYTTAEGPGLETVGFQHSFAFFTLSMGLLCVIYLICALRTNLIFVGIFISLIVAFGLLTAVFFETPQGNLAMAHNMTVAAGACVFVTCLLGWYLFFGIMVSLICLLSPSHALIILACRG